MGNTFKLCLSFKGLSLFLFTGQLLLAKGEVDQASAAFKIVLDGDRDSVPALLGQVRHIGDKAQLLPNFCTNSY